MTDSKNVAMFKQINGEKVQIGWASPVDEVTGGRTLERIPAYEREVLTDISFEDDEQSQETAAEHEGHASEEVVVEHNFVIEPEVSDDEDAEETEPLPAEPEDAGRDTEQDADPELLAPDVPEETLEDEDSTEENN